MVKIGRNDYCPCGSGKKYKKCCISLPDKQKEQLISEQSYATAYAEVEELCLLSNSVTKLIKEGQLKKAEKVCQKLLKDYPDQVDGLHRYAEVYEAKGDKNKAIEHYEKTIKFMKTHDGFDDDSYAWPADEIIRLKAK